MSGENFWAFAKDDGLSMVVTDAAPKEVSVYDVVLLWWIRVAFATDRSFDLTIEASVPDPFRLIVAAFSAESLTLLIGAVF